MPKPPSSSRSSKRRRGCFFKPTLALTVGAIVSLIILASSWQLLARLFPHQYMWMTGRMSARSSNLNLELDGLVVDGQGVPIPGVIVHLTVDEWSPLSSERIPFKKVDHQVTTDASGQFSYRGTGRQVRVMEIDGPGKWFYDLDVGHYVVGEPNRCNAIYESDWEMSIPYRVKPGSPAVFVIARDDQSICVMPQRGGTEVLRSGQTLDNGPVFPRSPSILLTPDFVMREDHNAPSWTPAGDKAEIADKVRAFEHELVQRLQNCTQLHVTTGPLRDIEPPSWAYQKRDLGNEYARRIRASWMVQGSLNRALVEVVVHFTSEGFRPVALQVRPDTNKGRLPPIPLWTKEEINEGLSHFPGTQAQRDALFNGWETDARAAVNVIEWMKTTRPVVWPYPVN